MAEITIETLNAKRNQLISLVETTLGGLGKLQTAMQEQARAAETHGRSVDDFEQRVLIFEKEVNNLIQIVASAANVRSTVQEAKLSNVIKHADNTNNKTAWSAFSVVSDKTEDLESTIKTISEQFKSIQDSQYFNTLDEASLSKLADAVKKYLELINKLAHVLS